MGIFATIFGSGKVIEKGMDLIDSFHTSDVEMVEAKTGLLKAYEPFKIAQRYLAVMFTINFIASFWVAVLLWAFDKDLDGFLTVVTSFNIGWIMLAIVSFYFGGGALEGVMSARKKGV